MNSVNLIGNIGHDLELRETQGGSKVLNMNIAINDGKDQQGNPQTTWVRVVAWNKQAENTVRFCGKGSKVGISGRLNENNWTDDNGNERNQLEVVAFRVEFLDSRGDSQSNQGNYQPQRQQQSQPQQNFYDAPDPFANDNTQVDIDPDNLPF